MSLKILDQYPKTRPLLPSNFKDIYSKHYIYCRSNKGLIRKVFTYFTNWMHLQVSKKSQSNKNILELGAGTLNHIKFETFEKYDVIEPFDDLFNASLNKDKITKRYNYTTDLSDNLSYDRIISIATLEHLTNLPKDLALLAKKLKKNGIFQHSYPSESGFLWYCCSRYISGLNFYLKYKLNFDTFLKHEHVNNAREIEKIINLIFNKVQVRRFPLNLLHLSVFSYIEAKEPNIEVCDAILSKFKNYKYETIF